MSSWMRFRSCYFVAMLGVIGAGRATAAEPGGGDVVVVEEEQPSELMPDVAELRGAGYRLRDLHIDEAPDASGEIRVALTLAKGKAAEKLTVRFGNWGSNVVGYARETVAAPAEPRIYRDEQWLLDTLANGEITELSTECGGWYILTSNGDAGLDDLAYHVVDRRVTGDAAGKTLARELAGALEDGLKLTDVREAYDDAGTRGMDFVFVAGGTRTIHVALDDDGGITSVEVRRSPEMYAWQTVHTSRALPKALRKGKAVTSLALEEPAEAAGPRLVGTLRSGRRFVIDLGDVERHDEEDGCGC